MSFVRLYVVHYDREILIQALINDISSKGSLRIRRVFPNDKLATYCMYVDKQVISKKVNAWILL